MPKFRSPAVAGQFYESDGQRLARQIESCFMDPRGPGHLPPHHRSKPRQLRAAIVPHAGYRYSGPIAAHVYAAIAAEEPPTTVLILGVDHHGGAVRAATSNVDWLTPLGPVEIDNDVVGQLAKPPIVIDEETQALEHSIEVQLPFLQYVLPHPRFVPLMVRYGSYDSLHEIAVAVRSVVASRPDILVLASTDFSHYVPASEADRLDHLAISEILRSDPKGLYSVVARHDISMCGIAPTTVLLDALQHESLTPTLLRWGHSGEDTPMPEVVGYAAITLTRT
ncbi:MAG: AmmeMemoRadiSam system protein B [Thermoplasmata archaeon]